MTIEERVNSIAELAAYLDNNKEKTEAFAIRAEFENPWFTQANIQKALSSIQEQFLDKAKLDAWISQYDLSNTTIQTVGIIMAGNIPLVGFQDLLCVLISGHKVQIKLSDKDKVMTPYLTKALIDINPSWSESITYVDKMANYDAVIATGSNNTSRYFETYFSKVPNIIRKNRNSIAVLNGKESDEEILKLGDDIFTYYGLGCRSVSKIFIPEDYDLNHFLEVLHVNKELIRHTKYKNNFDYNFALHSINNEPIHINGCLIMREDKSLHSRIATLHFEKYSDIDSVAKELKEIEDQLQVIISSEALTGLNVSKLGQGQAPTLLDYADGVDVMTFLTEL